MTKFDFQDQPPQDGIITAYDRLHAALYMRLLDADAAGASFDDIVITLFGIQPKAEPERALLVYESHLARAKWMTTHGYCELLRPIRN